MYVGVAVKKVLYTIDTGAGGESSGSEAGELPVDGESRLKIFLPRPRPRPIVS